MGIFLCNLTLATLLLDMRFFEHKMVNGRSYFSLFLVLLLILIPQLAQAQRSGNFVEPSNPVYVQEDSAVVQNKAGCQKLTGTALGYVYGTIFNASVYYKTVIYNTARTPQLVIPGDQNWNNISKKLDILKESDLYLGPFYYCTPEAIKSLTVLSDPAYAAAKDSTIKKNLLKALMYLVYLVALVGAWVLALVLKLFSILLTANKFITHPFVVTGWPFVQGIANLGFIIALLFIAFATSLRLESFSARRMLPRLLISALLINFSLVLTGILVDLSRLLMAIMASQIAGDSLENMAASILEKSAAFNLVFTGLRKTGSLSLTSMAYDFPTYMLQATIMIWGLLAGFIVITVGFFVRYVALIMLLIVSPIAFLAFALPGAQKVAEKWWSEFIKYLLYGPLALFVLLILVAVVGPQGGQGVLNVAVNSTLLESAISLTVVVGMLIAAATVGKHVGIAGSAATVGFMKGQGKKILRAPITHPKTTAAVLGGVATAGVGTTLGAGAALYGAKKTGLGGVAGRQGTRLADRAARATGVPQVSPHYWEERKAQKEKVAKKQKADSYGKGRAQYNYASPDKRARLDQEATWVRETKTAPPTPGNAAFAPDRLRNRPVAKSVSGTQLRALADGMGTGHTNDDQINAIVNSPDMVSNMDIDTPQIIITELRNRTLNPAATAEQKREAQGLLQALNKSIREAERRTDSESK